jgi:hypothetical protein
MGFMSRMLPFTYSYGSETVRKVFDHIQQGNHLKLEPVELQPPAQELEVGLEPELARRLELDARAVAEAYEVYGFRAQRQLQALAKAHALQEGRRACTQRDVDVVRRLARWFNLEYRPIKG